MTEQRTKEIGIRKVLGASSSKIVVLLSKEFIRWILVSYIIAAPVGIFLTNRWLQNFAYRTNVGAWIYILSGVIALSIAFLTILYQVFKTAAVNPADTMRYE